MAGISNELKKKRDERDTIWAENQTLKRKLQSAEESNDSLKEQLEIVKSNMANIIDKYDTQMTQERQKLAMVHNQALRQEQAANIQQQTLVKQREEELAQREEWLAEKDEVIFALCDEGNTWVDRFATVMRGSQYLPELVERAEQMADVFSTPDEIKDLFNYCKDMIELMKDIVRRR